MASDQKERALKKVKVELDKDILLLTELTKHFSLGELQYFIYYLHIIRILPQFGDIAESEKEITAIYSYRVDDAIKYLIQVISKHCTFKYRESPPNNLLINLHLVELANELALRINSKFETFSYISMFNKIEVYGERDQNIKINLRELLDDPRLCHFYYYGARIERANHMQKEDLKIKDAHIGKFVEEYKEYADLFFNEFEVTLVEFTELIHWFLDIITDKMKAEDQNYERLDNGNVDVQAYKTIILFSASFLISKNLLIEKFGEKYNLIIERLTFKNHEFSESQLSYDLISRQPIIQSNDFFIISPEILLDSLFINSHYSLLEAGASKEEYKKRYANYFVDRILNILEIYGFKEFARNFELYEGKNQLGDLDLVVKNNKNEFLLIEAKNHTLPLEVYFHNMEAMEKRLEMLTNEWERKVQKRKAHLKNNYHRYGIASNFKYIIVSKQPEIISHFSSSLILSIEEFEYWLEKGNLDSSFDTLFRELYRIDENIYSKEQLDSMQNELKTGWRFEKE